jgi:hypothetical protein
MLGGGYAADAGPAAVSAIAAVLTMAASVSAAVVIRFTCSSFSVGIFLGRNRAVS